MTASLMRQSKPIDRENGSTSSAQRQFSFNKPGLFRLRLNNLLLLSIHLSIYLSIHPPLFSFANLPAQARSPQTFSANYAGKQRRGEFTFGFECARIGAPFERLIIGCLNLPLFAINSSHLSSSFGMICIQESALLLARSQSAGCLNWYQR